MGFVQGFLTEVSIDATDTTQILVDVSLTRSKSELDKSVMDGSGVSQSIPGMQSGQLAFSGHISQAELNGLEFSFAKTVPVGFTITILEGLTTDGEYSGEFAFNTLDVESTVDGNWELSGGGPTSGPVTYTNSAP